MTSFTSGSALLLDQPAMRQLGNGNKPCRHARQWPFKLGFGLLEEVTGQSGTLDIDIEIYLPLASICVHGRKRMPACRELTSL